MKPILAVALALLWLTPIPVHASPVPGSIFRN
jgi:hypothetical protein